jgi:hypothetical protein
VSRNPLTGCWLWTGARNAKGYGTFKLNMPGFTGALAHRASYRLHVGEIPAGLQVAHHCDNPRCVNPAHLYLASNEENQGDRVRRNLLPKSHRVRRLTDAAVASAQPAAQDAFLCDGDRLYLRVRATGGKSWIVRKKSRGLVRLITLGRFPDLSLREARLRASVL